MTTRFASLRAALLGAELGGPMTLRRASLRAVLLGAALSAGCTAPLILAEEPAVDSPLVPVAPVLPGNDAEATDAAGEDPQISEVDGGRDAASDAARAGPNNAEDGGDKPMRDAALEDAGGG